MKVFVVGIIIAVGLSTHCFAKCRFGEELIGKTLVTQQDLFIYQRGAANTTVSAPNWGSDVPPSVDCYLADPDNWPNSPEAQARGVSSDIENVKVLAVLPSGTRMRVSRFHKRRNSFVGQFYVVYGTVDDPRFSDREVRFLALFRGTGGKDFNVRPREEFLRLADSQQ